MPYPYKCEAAATHCAQGALDKKLVNIDFKCFIFSASALGLRHKTSFLDSEGEIVMHKSSEEENQWYKWFDREKIVHNLEFIQNLIVVLLCISLFCIMVIRLGEIFLSLLHPLKFQNVTSDLLFILILVELFRLLIIYLQEQRISIGVAVEVSIVSVLREVIIREVLEIPWQQILAVCAFLLVLAALLLTRAWIARIFNPTSDEKNKAMVD